MPPKRISSKLKNKQLETRLLEQETSEMEQKLQMLRQQVAEQKKMKETSAHESTLSRWKKVTGGAPIKNYANKVLADRKQALNKFGIDENKILGSKSFEPALSKIKSDKLEADSKNPTKLNQLQYTGKPNAADSLPVHSISNNFFNAKMKPAELVHQKTLQEFLEQNFLQEYLPVLTRNSIYELDDLYQTSRDRMASMGIKPGHQFKLIKRLKSQIQGHSHQKQVTQLAKDQPPAEQQKVQFGYGDGDVNDYAEISNNEFLHHKAQDNHQSSYTNNEAEELEASSDDPEEQEDVVILTNPMVEFQLQAVPPQQPTNQLAFNCFQCYNRSANDPLISSDSRKFCCTQCLDQYLQFMQKTCPECNNVFFKFNGHHQDGLWFCSIACCPNRQQIEQMFLSWANQHC